MHQNSYRRAALAALVLFLAVGAVPSQDLLSAQGPIAIRGVTLIAEPGAAPIENATILIVDGHIAAAGVNVLVPPGTREIDGSERVAYAGFIEGFRRLEGDDAANADEERRREGEFPDISETPQIETVAANRRGIDARSRIEDRLDVQRETFAAARKSGFTAGLVAPPQALVGGLAAVVQFSDGPTRSALLRSGVGHTASLDPPQRRSLRERSNYPGTPLGVAAHLRQFFLDAAWQQQMSEYVAGGSGRGSVAFDPDLAAAQELLAGDVPLFWSVDQGRHIQRALDLASEFKLRSVIVGGREAASQIDLLRERATPVVLALEAPAKVRSSELKDENLAPGVDERDPAVVFGSKWDERPFHPPGAFAATEAWRKERLATAAQLEAAGVPWCVTLDGVRRSEDGVAAIHDWVTAGVSEEALLRAMTTRPAQMLGLDAELGTIARGKRANITLTRGRLGEEKFAIDRVFVDGEEFALDEAGASGNRGGGPPRGDRPRGGRGRGRGAPSGAAADAGAESTPTGDEDAESQPASAPDSAPQSAPTPPVLLHRGDWALELEADRGSSWKTGGNVLLTNATVLTVSGAALPRASVLVQSGKIAAVGADVRAPQGVAVVDLTGYTIMPGVIDPHAHIAIDGVNEGTMSVTPEVRIRDVLVPTDPSIYWALSGGTTTIHTMHGSANTIGGQNYILKLKPGRPVGEMIVPDQVRTVKFALGENVKRPGMSTDRWDREAPRRFPGTRMGVETTLNRAFAAGQEYASRRAAWQPGDAPLRRDLRLEALADILAGDIWINCHNYRADEILRLLDVAEGYGVRVAALHHCLEAYRIMPEIARHGAGTATFSDWWAYKVEAYNAVPHNAGMLLRAGINSTLKSDSDDLMRHMQIEAAKSVHYAGLSSDEALRLITLNAARLFGLDDRMGSIEVGKDADLAVFDGHPLDTFAKCVLTLVDGEAYFLHRDFDPASPKPPQRSLPPLALARRSDDARTQTANPVRQAVTPPPAPPKPGARAYAIINATIHPIHREPLQGTLLIEDGKISAVGQVLRIPPDAVTVDAAGLHVWPGLINAGTSVGLYEVGQVGVTVDTSESGTYQPDVFAVSAFHPHSSMIEVTRCEGITSVVSMPSGPTIAGQAGMLDLAGWTMPEMLVERSVGLVVSLPSRAPQGILEENEPEDPNRERPARDDAVTQQVRDLARLFHNARRYSERRDANPDEPRDVRLEALEPYVRGERPVFFSAGGYKSILAAIHFADRLGLRPVIVGGRDAWKLADLLAERQIPVIYEGVYDLPSRLPSPPNATDAWDSNYRSPSIMHAAGVRFCFAASDASLAKNLAHHAGFAVAHGIDPDAAMRGMTLSAAEILGVADRYGSLEVRKVANVIITDDHPARVTHRLTHVFIRGQPVSLESQHTRQAGQFADRPWPEMPPLPELRGPKSQTQR